MALNDESRERSIGTWSTIPLVGESWKGIEQLESRLLMSVSQDVDGWTVIDPSNDTNVIYVSSSSGSDSNDGLSAGFAVKTLAKGHSLLRNGSADWMLLKKGDVWSERLTVKKDGRSTDEVVLISSYGDGDRPRIENEKLVIDANYVAIIGLHLKNGDDDGIATRNYSRNPSANPHDILLEDVYIENKKIGLNSRGSSNIALRRSIIADNTKHGIWTRDNDNYLIEENLIDDNGTSEVFDQNIYKSVNTKNVIIRSNILSRGANLGLKYRAGTENSVIEDNLFVENKTGLALGHDKEDPADYLHTNLTTVDNVFLQNGRSGRGEVLTMAHLRDAVISDNILAHSSGSGNRTINIYEDNNAITLANVDITNNIVWNVENKGFRVGSSRLENVTIEGNVINAKRDVWQMRPGNPDELQLNNNTYYSSESQAKWFDYQDQHFSFSQWQTQTGDTGSTLLNSPAEMGFLDPDRTLQSYSALVGGAFSTEAFYAAARQQSRDNWNPQYTAQAVNDYIREGFNIAPDTNPEDDTVAPSATLSAADVNNAGGSAHTFSVTYRDNLAVDVSDMDSLDIRVTGPNGFSQNATFVGVNQNYDGSIRSATYRIDAPGGAWGVAHNGTYTVTMTDNQVSDLNDNYVPASTLGKFDVDAKSLVSVSATDADSAEPNNPGHFTITRTGDTSAAMTVEYQLSGTAAAGSDYQGLAGSVTIAAGSQSAMVQITPIDDGEIEDNENVVLTITDGPVYNVDGSAGNAAITIADNDTATGTEEMLIRPGATWKFLDDGSNQGAAWSAIGFNDAGWASGRGQLGYGDGDEVTTIGFGNDANNKHITTYFRQHFDVSNAAAVTSLSLELLRDDGAVVYLNGTEVFRTNMPDGAIGHETKALEGIWGRGERDYLVQSIDRTLLVSGTNVVAVEIHQDRAQSSDVSFDLKLSATTEEVLQGAEKIVPPNTLPGTMMPGAPLQLNHAGDGSVSGSIDADDADVHLFSVDQGGVVNLGLNTGFNSQIALYDINGARVATGERMISQSLGRGSYYAWIAGEDTFQAGEYTLNLNLPWSMREPVEPNEAGDASISGLISHAGDNDYLVMVGPDNTDGTLTLSATPDSSEPLVISIFNTAQRRIAVSEPSSGGSATLRFDSVVPSATYYVSVGSLDASTGGYSLDVDFGVYAPLAPPVILSAEMMHQQLLGLNHAGSRVIAGEISHRESNVYLFSVDQIGSVHLSLDSNDFDVQMGLYNADGVQLQTGEGGISRIMHSGSYYAWVGGTDSGQAGKYTFGVNAPWSVRKAVTPDANGDATVSGMLDHAGDSDYYVLVGPRNSNGTLELSSGGAGVAISIRDGEDEIAFGNGSVSFKGVAPGATYYLSVRAADDSTESYSMDIKFGVNAPMTPPAELSRSMMSVESLPLNHAGDGGVSSSISEGQSNIHLFSVDQAGIVSLSITSDFNVQMALYDGDGTIITNGVSGFGRQLSEGSYYVWVSGSDVTHTGDYVMNVDAPWSVREDVQLDVGGNAFVSGSLEHNGDAGYFVLVGPENTRGNLTLTATPFNGQPLEITIYNPAQRVVSSSEASGGSGSTSLKFDRIVAGATYYVRVGSGVASIGSYGLAVDFGVDAPVEVPQMLASSMLPSNSLQLNHAGDVRVDGTVDRGQQAVHLFSVDQAGQVNIDLASPNFKGQMAVYGGDGVRLLSGQSRISENLDAGSYYVWVSGTNVAQFGDYALQIDASWAARQQISIGDSGRASLTGQLDHAGDTDYFALVVPSFADGPMRLRATGDGNQDLVLNLFKPNQQLVGQSDQTSAGTESLQLETVVSGTTFYVSVGSDDGSVGSYALQVEFDTDSDLARGALETEEENRSLFLNSQPARQHTTPVVTQVADPQLVGSDNEGNYVVELI